MESIYKVFLSSHEKCYCFILAVSVYVHIAYMCMWMSGTKYKILLD